jgi:amino acid transporter
MQKYDLISVTAPLSSAFSEKGLKWASILISIGAFSALTTTMMTSLIAAPRIYFSMSRDGLLPKWVSNLNQRFKTPIVATFITGFYFFFIFIYFYF